MRTVTRTVGIGSHLTRSVYSTLEPGKCLWLFLQAKFWCLGVWALDQQDVPAGREWSAYSQPVRERRLVSVNCWYLFAFLLPPTCPTKAFSCHCLGMSVLSWLVRSPPQSSGKTLKMGGVERQLAEYALPWAAAAAVSVVATAAAAALF